ncbi:MAG: secreted metal-binding protein [uncultured bacterium]|uniref:EfeO-type cupredoxin-like domain-containing protein n=1 Tax=Candidatus Woesebacteria bacterium RIFCSPHIGHO2_12_FULL_41_24 TaxID=1802510 RepID=A0A1F8AUC7_9BACT|nr:MAG: secreted metal-binding protein [uncultured bacterium]OGM14372.1 MAG: hypothetical protein A2W15_02375 [Candidatus Woesebacteria bacterium RBG_16_41_13]OGM30767.1 MAG: hypothetical protein A2873_03455 [Candidatus Woesebacteria bacterium RIFCSPHIGHO2_01_FULL_42_80]OGM34189.1 MAG: hypothetical protein A3D84_04225 [Candidatus Woesebacteria bacterium RIFCSPHIGHO2_02_FULL_42_20]OGM55354.1 MAG: hypothetical protein A3E44_03670 [Candidatus Woesebacteria bacterium RIFCSPHIGHO2_12_FULL_41_24]OGM
MNKGFLLSVVVVIVVVIGFVVVRGGNVTPVPTPVNFPFNEGPRLEEDKIAIDNTETLKESDLSSQGAVDEITIEIKNFAFSPKTFKVKPGAKVTVVNRDTAAHTMTANDGSSFGTKLLNKGESVIFTAPSAESEYAYHCTPHPSMTGTLVVEN